MVRIDVVVTRGGDAGETSLGDGTRLRKDAPRIVAIGAVDEANAAIGVLRLQTRGDPDTDAMLARVQNDLFDVGADISVPSGGERERLRVIPSQVEWLEKACDEVNAELEPLRSFVLPGGSPEAAQLHVCRTVCRRAERRVIACGDAVNAETVRYLNRLSDLLFILARAANGGEEPLWEPGRNR